MLDILDENGIATGETMDRKEVHTTGLWHRCVHIWVMNSSRELLLQKRSIKARHHPGQWEASASGHVSAGESKLEAAVKELSEEVGINADPSEFIFIDEIKVRVDRGDNTGTNNHIDDIYLLEHDVAAEDVVFQKEEVDSVEFVPWRELRERYEKEKHTFIERDQEYKTLFEFLEENFEE